jgi:dolichol-phosphate mannosyltransferase
MPLLTLVVPTYDEAEHVAENIVAIVRTLETLDEEFEVLVVCDGSTDETIAEVERIDDPRVRVLSYAPNQGKGYAICFAFAYARGRLVGWLDGGLDIEPRAIVDAVRRFDHTEIDAVIGSKRHRDSQVDYRALRCLMSWTFQILARSLVQVNVRDTQVGAKVFRREMLDVVVPLLLIKRYAFDLELLAVGVEFGFDRIEEMPIRLDYRFTGTSINRQAVQQMLIDTLAISYRLHLRHWYVRQFSAHERERVYEQRGPEASLSNPLGRASLDSLARHP